MGAWTRKSSPIPQTTLVTGNWGIGPPIPSFGPGIATFAYTSHAHSLLGRSLYLVIFPGIVVCHKLYPMFWPLYFIRLYPTVHYTSPLYLSLLAALMTRMRVIYLKWETTFFCHYHHLIWLALWRRALLCRFKILAYYYCWRYPVVICSA